MNTTQRISHYLQAGYPGLYIVSHEEQRVEALLRDVIGTMKTKNVKFDLHAWSVTTGIVSIAKEPSAVANSEDPFAALQAFDSMPAGSVVLLRDFHMMISDRNPILYRKLKDSLMLAKANNRMLVICGCSLKLEPELEKEITVVDFALPDREQIKQVMFNVAASATPHVRIQEDIIDSLIDAAMGLTTIEAENAFALSIVETKEIVASVVAREKAATIRKNGMLELITRPTSLDDIGGLEVLKRDLASKRARFTKKARDYGLPSPRGVLLVGQPGTGKSLCAEAAGNIFGIPLLRLEAGKLFGSLVGQSESNWRSVFATAKSIAPCVLWLDEIESLFCGAQSSGQTDSGVTMRVIKAILQDMQFNSEGIFYMFTANDIDGLPDPLVDRLDVWSVDLPTQVEREAVWKIHIAKRGRDPKKFDLPALAKATEGFSGRQIGEHVWLKAMELAFNNGEREPKTSDCIAVAKMTAPTSETMAEAITRRRNRLKNRAMKASELEPVPVVTTGRKLAA